MSGAPTVALKRLATKIGSGKTPTGGSEVYASQGVAFLRSQNVRFEGLDLSDVAFIDHAVDAEMASTRVRAGDVLLNITGASIGRCSVVGADIPEANVNQHVAIVRPRESVDPRFINWSLQSQLVQDRIAAMQVGGNRDGLNFEQVGGLPVPDHPTAKMSAVADFLDAETARIDALIAKKRRLIELLEERCEAAIFHFITRGLHNRRPLRPSGLSWVAEIPDTWGTPTVSANFELQLGKMLSAEATSGPEQFPYVRNVNVQWDRFALDDLATMHFTEQDRRRCELRPGDLLVCEGGEVGRAAVWNNEMSNCYFQKAIHRVRPRGGANSRYLMYCLRAAAKRSVFAVEGNLSTIVHLTGEQLRVHRFPWPPGDEQVEIVEHLDRLARQVEQTRSQITRQVDLLVEHRQALITAAVTGELSVPGVAA